MKNFIHAIFSRHRNISEQFGDKENAKTFLCNVNALATALP